MLRVFVFSMAILALAVTGTGVASAAVYTVGDQRGWTYNVAAWPKGKRFKAGDVLVFKYDPAKHNVVPVSAAGYNSCSAPKNARTLNSGNGRVTLKRGRNYFISSSAGDCENGMKIAVDAN
ncbi:hypothetical protein JMUB6875_72310 [Nocardia sp. JMUB6875]